jgi:hypothetical protein
MNLQQVLSNARNRGNLGSVVDVLRGVGVEGIEAALKASGPMPHGWWTLERCKESALRFKTKAAWKAGESGAYQAAYTNGWLDECCAHLPRSARIVWTREACLESALRYKARYAWRRGDEKAYAAARKNKWLGECCAHMEPPAPSRVWTLEECKASAQKYKTRFLWSKGDARPYRYAKSHRWLDKCCAHMKLPPQRWTLEKCKADALLYKTHAEWRNNSLNAYHAARRYDWLGECRVHMLPTRREPWTLEACKAEALRHKSRSEWREGGGSSYAAAQRNGWYEECVAHMGSAWSGKREPKP